VLFDFAVSNINGGVLFSQPLDLDKYLGANLEFIELQINDQQVGLQL
jgi:hypothetical protein